MRKRNVDNFKKLYDTLSEKYAINLVLSSSWRVGHEKDFKRLITTHGFYDLKWNKTPMLGSCGKRI